MKLKNFIILLLCSIALVSCNKDGDQEEDGPTACFTFTVFEGEVTFNSNCSKNAVLHEWNFGDTETSTLANPSHQYLTSSSFSVSLKVTDSDGNVNIVSKTVVTEDFCRICPCDSNLSRCGNYVEVTSSCSQCVSIGGCSCVSQ